MSLVVFVLHDPEKLQAVLAAWETCGISGATVLYSTGLGKIREAEGLRDDIPLIPSISEFFSHPEHHGRTIFTIVDNDAIIPSIIDATERVVGDLLEPNRGILAVLPTTLIRGMRKK
jgi:hypothetical protein